VIHWRTGDLFASDADALVDPVNCLGASGAGLAKAFRQRFPLTERVYQEACRQGRLRPGTILVEDVHDRLPASPVRTIVFFPTKDDWRRPGRLEWVDQGLAVLAARLADGPDGIRRIAVPALGCDLAGLAWADVRPLVAARLGTIPDVEVLAYEPLPGRARRPVR
jgi:O-acetyl-ADP-ribose deacetylase (regulator of RNase III)